MPKSDFPSKTSDANKRLSGKKLILATLAGIIGIMIGSWLLSNTPLYAHQGTRIQIFDFAYYVSMISLFWSRPSVDIYSFSDNQLMLQQLFDFVPATVMPFGISPSSVLILAPWAGLARWSLDFSFLMWLGLSCAALATAILIVIDTWPRQFLRDIPAITLLVVVLASDSFLGALLRGQTSALALAGLLYLTYSCFSGGTKPSGWIRDAGILALLSIKLPYFIIASLTLLIFRRHRAALTGTAIAACAVAFALALSPPGTFRHFIGTLSLFSSQQIPPHYAGAFSFSEISTLATALPDSLSRALRATLSLVLAAVCLGAVVIRKFKATPIGPSEIILIVGSYLLFSPYVGAYEDILLLLPALFIFRERDRTWNIKVIVTLILSAIYLNRGILDLGTLQWTMCPVKFAIFACLLLVARGTSRASVTRLA